ncbi:MAG: porin family protein [Tannerella sp.]|jgi:opacity protein-like surface antigen|nr:porin family protein [Tannerella sp.]
MKKIGLLAVCIVSFVTVGFAQNNDIKYNGEKGVSSIGAILGYAIDNKTIAVGIDYRYNIKDRVRLAPSVLYTVKNEDKSMWVVNADAHYLMRVTDKMTIYPLGGLGLSVWNLDYKKVGSGDKNSENKTSEDKASEDKTPEDKTSVVEVSETKVRLGLNLGFGGEMRVTQDIIIGAEFRYNLTSKRIYDQAMILVRAAYYF